MAARTAWVLNLDADLELASPARYAPTRKVLESMRPHVERLARALLVEGDLLVDAASPDGSARGLRGRAFCPTPRAIAILRRVGAEPEPHPDVEVLRRVNSRAFAASLGATLPGAAFVGSLDAARAIVAAHPDVGDEWRMKRAFGMAGRGHRVVHVGALAESDVAFLRNGLLEGGVQIEPNVAIATEYAIHGMLAEGGALRLGSVVRQRCDPRGAWLATEPLDDAGLHGDVPERLVDEARAVALALHHAGYFGPFGVDAFTYRDRDGALRLQPRSEINARYSMGFAVGFGRA
jgi:hypothetical protein